MPHPGEATGDITAFALLNKKEIEDHVRNTGWTKWDVRLSKVIRSCWMFGEKERFESLQLYAWSVFAREKQGKAFKYGPIDVSEMLFMRLE